jgi:hypothetical protein
MQAKKKRRRLVAPKVMVDELVVYPNAWGPFLRGSCHMTCSDLDTLHRFAERLGLKRSWFQEHVRKELCHYDLTAGKRAQALAMGAVFVPIMEQARAAVKTWKTTYRVSVGILCAAVVVRNNRIIETAPCFKHALNKDFRKFREGIEKRGGTVEVTGGSK